MQQLCGEDRLGSQTSSSVVLRSYRQGRTPTGATRDGGSTADHKAFKPEPDYPYGQEEPVRGCPTALEPRRLGDFNVIHKM